MKPFLTLLLLALGSQASAQTLPSHVDILKTVYGPGFDAALIDGVRNCPADPGPEHDRCMALPSARAGLRILKEIKIAEGLEFRVYALTEIEPRDTCHACAPSLGMAVFVWRANHWQIESERPDASDLGTFGAPAHAELIRIGPHLHGFLLTLAALGQGFEETEASLIAPAGQSVDEIWSGPLHQLLEGDEADGVAKQDIPDMDASIHFESLNNSDHDQIVVVRRGRGYDPLVGDRTVRPMNRTEIYRFKDGKYQLYKKFESRSESTIAVKPSH